jgi:hypothetical protein
MASNQSTPPAHGGKRQGAGRPIKQDSQAPISFRPKTQELRDEYFKLGASKWVNETLQASVDSRKAPPGEA